MRLRTPANQWHIRGVSRWISRRGILQCANQPINQSTEDVEEQRLDDARRKRWLRFRLRRQLTLEGRTNQSSRYGQG